MTPADRLVAALSALRWSQRSLAAETGRTPTTVRRWALGQAPIPVWVLPGLERLVAFHRENPIAPE
jgi:transcriptional regulator with XRE-family HTH domain